MADPLWNSETLERNGMHRRRSRRELQREERKESVDQRPDRRSKGRQVER